MPYMSVYSPPSIFLLVGKLHLERISRFKLVVNKILGGTLTWVSQLDLHHNWIV